MGGQRFFFYTSLFFSFASEEWKPEPITLDVLRREKTFKLGKKQLQEMDKLKKKHLKERQTMQKNHCSAIDKLVKGKEYVFGTLIGKINYVIVEVYKLFKMNQFYHTLVAFYKHIRISKINYKGLSEDTLSVAPEFLDCKQKNANKLLNCTLIFPKSCVYRIYNFVRLCTINGLLMVLNPARQ